MSTTLYALPFAESKPMDGHDMGASVVDPWVNDLEDFPPLGSLKPASASCSNAPSSSSSSNKSKDLRIQREWELVEGIEFSSHTEDDWEDIDYSTTVPQGSFASMAARACVDHEQAIPVDKFIVWPKRHQRRMRRRHIVQEEQSAVMDDDNGDDDCDLATMMYEAHKSQSRLASRRIPYMQRRRRQIFDVVIRRHTQAISQEQDQHKTRRLKYERDIAAIQMMRDKAYQLRHTLEMRHLPSTTNSNTMALLRSWLIYELRHRLLIPDHIKSPSRPMPVRTSNNRKRRNKHQPDDDEVLQKLFDDGKLPHYDYEQLDNQRILGILASGVYVHVNGNKMINTNNSQQVLNHIVSQFAKQDYLYSYYQRDTTHTYRRILMNLYKDDYDKFVNAEKQLHSAMASDDIAPLKAMFRTLPRDCFTPRDRNMRKQLIAHHFDQWKQISQNLAEQP